MRITHSPIAVVAFAIAMAIFIRIDKAEAAPNGNAPSSGNILHDPQIPSVGNPNGDVTIVEFFDYQCSPCKLVNPILHQIVREDGNIRLVFKDRPIFGAISLYAARLGIAAKYQNKFSEAHDALLSIQGRLGERTMIAALKDARIDIPRLQRDLALHQAEIDTILTRNQEQASALGFRGTPAFLIEKFRVPAVFNTKDLPNFIAEARLTKLTSGQR